MSAMKEYAAKIQQAVEVADLDCYAAMVSLMTLSDLAWKDGGDEPVWSPDDEWLATTDTQLRMAQNALEELRTARTCQLLEGQLL
jgi:hypothetical protein